MTNPISHYPTNREPPPSQPTTPTEDPTIKTALEILSTREGMPSSLPQIKKEPETTLVDQIPLGTYLANLDKSGSTEPWTKESITPKDVLHFIWLGKPFVEREDFKNNVSKFREELPRMWIVLWTDNIDPETQRFCLENKILLANVHEEFLEKMPHNLAMHYQYNSRQIPPNYGRMSDILRYQIMYKFGGIYLDVDLAPHHFASKGDLQKHLFTTLSQNPISIREGWNDRLYSEKILDPFWGTVIQTICERLNLPYEKLEELKISKGAYGLKSYVGWSTVLTTGPCALRAASNTYTKKTEIGVFPSDKFFGALSWLSGPVKFANNWKSSSFEEEINLLNRAVDAIIDGFSRGKVKMLHYLFLIEKFAHIKSAKEQLFYRVKNALKNLPENAPKINVIYVRTPEQHKELFEAIPEKLNNIKASQGELRTYFKALRFGIKYSSAIPEDPTGYSKNSSIKFLKASKIVITSQDKEIFKNLIKDITKLDADYLWSICHLMVREKNTDFVKLYLQAIIDNFDRFENTKYLNSPFTFSAHGGQIDVLTDQFRYPGKPGAQDEEIRILLNTIDTKRKGLKDYTA